MSRLLLYPYRRLGDTAVEAASWTIDGVPLEGFIKDATYDSVPEIEWRATVRQEDLAECLGNGEYLVEAVLGARAIESGVRQVLAKGSVPSSGGDVALHAKLNLAELSETIELSVRIVVASAKASPRDVGAPTQPGAILWSDTTLLRAFGVGSQFPLAVTDLRRLGLPEDTLWYLEVDDSEPEASFMGVVRLHINTKYQHLVPVLSGDPTGDAGPQLVSPLHLKLDLLRQLLRLAGQWHRDGLSLKSMPQDSLGAACFGVMSHVQSVGGLTRREVAENVLERPESLEPYLQAYLLGGSA